MMKNRFDQHIHSSFSYDADPECAIGRMAGAAVAKGLAGIAITDHLDPLWPVDGDTNFLDVTAYEKALAVAEGEWAGRIRFAKGVEVGLMPGECLSICEAVVNGYPYDFVIGAVHSTPTIPIDLRPFIEGREMRDVIDEYYTLFLECVKAYKNYDVLGHINVVDRYTDGYAPDSLYMPYIDEMLKAAVADGKGLEVNTSSFRYGIGDRGTPTLPILRRFRELGGEIVTIGSDAHRVCDVGSFIEAGEELLRSAGFRYIAVFKERRPEFVKL